MDEDEDSLCKYGTPLQAFEEDEIPSKKPVSVEDQIVCDANGKRRFHGAFTGGFSAGYWNTVGSEEGWKPTEFKSSRSEKVSAKVQNPMDFMDDEDLGEFGIAPQRVQTKEDFAHSSKATKRRIHESNWSGPIPGQPVLKSLLEPAREKTAVMMLKNMGWRPGQGIGERQSKVEKKKSKARNQKEMYVLKMYGCELPGSTSNAAFEDDTDSDSDYSDYEVSFAPDDFDPLVAAIKDNTFGLGYSGLERKSSTGQRFNLFDTLEIVDRNNKKLSIRGQAFGVGALEDDDDEDIYAKDDMSKYDFSLEEKSKKPAAIKSSQHDSCLEGFCVSKTTGKQMKKVFRVKVPEDYIPRNWAQRRSRFEPIDKTKYQYIMNKSDYKVQGLGRHDLDPQTRGKALGEIALPQPTENSVLDVINKRCDSFVAGEIINSNEPCSSKSDTQKKDLTSSNPPRIDTEAELTNIGSTKDGFKPFIADSDKQERYEKFVSFKSSEKYKTKEDFLDSMQPLGMSSWDRERELKEFIQAQRMYRPLDGLMSDRFVTECSLVAEKETDSAKPADIKMQRTRTMWKPHKELCKRFNVPEPFGGMLEEEKVKSKTKFSVFDYLEAPVNSKRDFVTPVIIPKHSVEDNKQQKASVPIRVAAKDFFSEMDKPSTSSDIFQQKKPIAPQPLQHLSQKKPEKRTELEQKVLDSIHKKPEEKKDLFKSIFCSSDEDEDESAIEAQSASAINEKEKMKLVENLVAIKPASEVNILRNNSPPRGIFKSILDIKKPAKVLDSIQAQDPHSCTSTINDSSSSSEDDAFYGPKLPSKAHIPAAPPVGAESQLDARLKSLLDKTKCQDSLEEWIEKGSISSSKGKKKKHKEHKKSKKHKKDKKKHKHKDKR